ncbi:MAG: beta-1,6-N-acetylglucosaminyltransferase, partial [Hyphomicrobiales bacterium]
MVLMAPSGQLKLGFALLAHEGVEAVSELIDTLISDGDTVSVHYDGRSLMPDFLALNARYTQNPQVLFARRVPCGWGDFSLVQGTLNALAEFRRTGASLDYVYLLSGADLPLKSLRSLKTFLASHLHDRAEFIESVPLGPAKWVRGGLEAERFAYRHYFNERRHPLLFKHCWTLQRRLGLKRKPPPGLRISLGSQWWCLTWDTCRKILDLTAGDSRINRYFRTTWIPDESYFQTLVRRIAGADRLKGHSLTFYHFSDYGKPVVFYDEHYS